MILPSGPHHNRECRGVASQLSGTTWDRPDNRAPSPAYRSPKQFLPDRESGHANHAARDRRFGVGSEPVLYIRACDPVLPNGKTKIAAKPPTQEGDGRDGIEIAIGRGS